MTTEKAAQIAALNDALRTDPGQGTIVMTQGFAATFDALQRTLILGKIAAFSDFTPENDPHAERDSGTLEHNGQTILWKIDYYDQTREYGSENPADPSITCRVMTLMLDHEY